MKAENLRKGDVILLHGKDRQVTNIKRKYPKRGTYVYGFSMVITLDETDTIVLPMGSNIMLVEKAPRKYVNYREIGYKLCSRKDSILC